jgi:hypothetical protein
MDTLNFSPFMLVYSWHVEPEGANVKPDEDSDTANRETRFKTGLKKVPIDVSVENKHAYRKSYIIIP